MALKRIKKYNLDKDVIGEYHRIKNVSSAFDTIAVEIYSSEQDRQDFKNGVFDSRFKKTDQFTQYRSNLKEMIETSEFPANCNNIFEAINHFAYICLKTESDYYTAEYFEDC